ncbi:hypothetical protein TNCV_1402421 [Trichonephila clavipes]|nr:hypothetical protein TNCV_1402421 [Trichonephila clavipes]
MFNANTAQDAQSHLGMPNRRNKVTKNGNGPSEGLFVGTGFSDQDFRRNLVISTAFIHGHENNNKTYNEHKYDK